MAFSRYVSQFCGGDWGPFVITAALLLPWPSHLLYYPCTCPDTLVQQSSLEHSSPSPSEGIAFAETYKTKGNASFAVCRLHRCCFGVLLLFCFSVTISASRTILRCSREPCVGLCIAFMRPLPAPACVVMLCVSTCSGA